MNSKEFDRYWNVPVKRIGMITIGIAAMTTFLPCIYVMITQQVFPPISVVLKAWGMIATSFAALYIVEPVSFYSVLGLSGTYLSFLSGNIGNIRVPAAAMALEVTDTTQGTQEAEVVSTLGITGSIITNIFFVTLAAFLGTALIKILPEVISEAFKNYTAPAIFGAVFGQFAIKYPKLAIFAFIIPVGMRIMVPSTPGWVLIILGVVGTIALSKALYKVCDEDTTKEI